MTGNCSFESVLGLQNDDNGAMKPVPECWAAEDFILNADIAIVIPVLCPLNADYLQIEMLNYYVFRAYSSTFWK